MLHLSVHPFGLKPPAGGWGQPEPALTLAPVAIWRTKVSGAPHVEHASRDAADARIDDLRRRYRAGGRAVRVVRLYAPDGGVRLIDFEREAKDVQRALRDVERATAVRDREVRAATERWEAAVARAVALGEPAEAVAAAAGTTVRQVRAIRRRRS